MKKLFSVLAVSLLVGLIVSPVKAELQSTFDGWQYTEIRTSGTVFVDGGRIGKVYASTDTTPGSNYFVICDTPGIHASNAAWPTSYPADVVKSPPLFFVSLSSGTGSINGLIPNNQGQMALLMDYGEYGLRISSAAYIFKTGAASGQALRVGVLWRK